MIQHAVRALLAVCTAMLFWVDQAHATWWVQATYCVDYNVNFTDEGAGDYLTGTSTPARGALLRFFPQFGPYIDHYLDWDGATPGCRAITIDRDLGPYTVKVRRQAFVNGNYIEVYDDIASPGIYVTTVDTSHTPSHGVQYDYAIGPTNNIRIMAAATWAIQRRAGSVSGVTFEFYEEGCGGGGSSCYDDGSSPPRMYISDSHTSYKFVIAHELGHALADAANDFDGNNVSYNAALNGCNDNGPDQYDISLHYMNSKEFQSAAAVEGIAHFYSAIAFNGDTTTTADCEMMKHYTPDWDSDGTVELAVEDATFNCDEAGAPNGVDGYDYTGDFCLGSGETNNRSTEYDWLRHLWEVHTAGGLSWWTIQDIWDAADPHSWNATGTGTGTGYPADRMSDAAHGIDPGTGAIYDVNAAFNGTSR